jgi:hypothetical protein
VRLSTPRAAANSELEGGGIDLRTVACGRFQRGDRTHVEESLSEGCQPNTAANVATPVPTVIRALRPLGHFIPSFSVALNWLTTERRTPIGAGMSLWRTVALLLGFTTVESAAEGLLLFNNPGLTRSGWESRPLADKGAVGISCPSLRGSAISSQDLAVKGSGADGQTVSLPRRAGS